MGNIFDYMDWRDIELEKVEFNKIDSLILSRFSYLPFDGLIKDKEKITIKECYERYKKNGKKENILMEDDNKLFPIMAASKRFGNLYISDYVNIIDKKVEVQFSAITVFLPDKTIAVLFRGTDNSLVGWKEDFNMTFSTKIPAQLDAANYLNKIASKYRGKIRVIGHSKGGNLSIYASAFCNKNVKNRIIESYNFDGPGFKDEIIESKEYNEIIDKIHNYIPQTSVIGRMLKHKGEIVIVKSIEKGIMQHDLYSWQVLGDKFIESELTNSSEFIDRTLTDWLLHVDVKQRKKFVDTVFEILDATQANNFSELSQKKFAAAKTIITKYQGLDEESKKYVNKALNMFLIAGRESIGSIRRK